MAESSNSSAVRRYFREIDRGNLDVIDEMCTTEYSAVFPGIADRLDRAGVKAMFAGFLAAFPGISHRIDELTETADTVSARLWISGVHGGEFMGVLPTGRAIGFAAVNTFEFSGGQISSLVIEFNSQDIMRQLLPARS